MVSKAWLAPRVVVLAAVSLLLMACLSKPASLQEHFAELDSRGYSGVILVAQDGVVLKQQAFGYASCDQEIENTIETAFAISSITKDFTAAAIAKLDSVGVLNIADPISKYLSVVPTDKAAITVEQLLQHRSGLRTYHETENLGDFESQTKEKALAVMLAQPLLFSPGSREEYSNSGYTLLAAIIEDVTGGSYVDFIRQNLLLPAGMYSTGFWGESMPPMAATENDVLGCSSTENWEYSWVVVGNGGMVSTLGDMHKWIEALRGETLFDSIEKQKYGYENRFRQNYGTAGGSSQHEFNAVIEYTANPATVVIAISNTRSVRAESIGMAVLETAMREYDTRHNARF